MANNQSSGKTSLECHSSIKNTKVAIVLLPGFALTSFSLAVETFSVANSLSPLPLYEVTIYSGDPDKNNDFVISSNNMTVKVDLHIDEMAEADLICLCAYKNAATYYYRPLNRLLLAHIAKGRLLAAFSSGSFLLAQAGLLDGATCTLTFEQKAIFEELYPAIPVQENLYTVSNQIYTCQGGTTTLDMMMYLIGVEHGADFAQQISLQFQSDRIRTLEEFVVSNKYFHLRMKSPALGAAIEVMDANIETPYSIEALAKMIGCSVRRLEMAFRKHLHTTPNKYYLTIRLEYAKKLIEETSIGLAEIAQATGFSSHSYMAKCFKDQYASHPSSLR